jgi:hypothetical protein
MGTKGGYGLVVILREADHARRLAKAKQPEIQISFRFERLMAEQRILRHDTAQQNEGMLPVFVFFEREQKVTRSE